MRSDFAALETYGYRDLIDKTALDFFGGELQDAYTIAASTPGEGETGVDQFGDNSGQTLPTTEASLAYGRAKLKGMGLASVDPGSLETGAMLAGSSPSARAGDGGQAYADLVAATLEQAGYNPQGVTADEIAAQLGISADAARAAIQGVGDPGLIEAVIAAHSQLVTQRGQLVGSAI